MALGDGAAARAAFVEAARVHDKLGERDRALLDAWEPTLARDKDDYTVRFSVTDDVGATVVATVLWTVK